MDPQACTPLDLRSVMFREGSRPVIVATVFVLTEKHTSCAHYVAKIWNQATLPLQQIDSFVNHGWSEDGSIDWINRAFPEKLESLFAEKKVGSSDDESSYDVNGEEDDDNLEEDEEEVNEGDDSE